MAPGRFLSFLTFLFDSSVGFFITRGSSVRPTSSSSIRSTLLSTFLGSTPSGALNFDVRARSCAYWWYCALNRCKFRSIHSSIW